MTITNRPRRMRQDDFSRKLMRENNLSVSHLIYPMFVIDGDKIRQDIPSMPGIQRLSIDELLKDAKECFDLGIPAIAIFPVIKDSLKSNNAEECFNQSGLVPKAVNALKKHVPKLGVITDIALDPYTTNGQDGLVDKDGNILNDQTVDLLVKQSLCHAKAGADIVAPSDMMDGRIKIIRAALEKHNYVDTKILSYSAKYSSNYYGPFRDAVGSVKNLGTLNKDTYQMDYSNSQDAIHEVEMDINEGADIVMVKPGMPYLDIVSKINDKFQVPIFIYQVSGEYAMIKAASRNNWLNEKKVVIESLQCMKRAGANAIITYYAKDALKWMK